MDDAQITAQIENLKQLIKSNGYRLERLHSTISDIQAHLSPSALEALDANNDEKDDHALRPAGKNFIQFLERVPYAAEASSR